MRSLHFITALRPVELGRRHVARKHAEHIRGSGVTCSHAMTGLHHQLQPQKRKKKNWLLAVVQVDLSASTISLCSTISFQLVTATADL